MASDDPEFEEKAADIGMALNIFVMVRSHCMQR